MTLGICNINDYLWHFAIITNISVAGRSFHFAVQVSRSTLHVLNSFHPLSLLHFGWGLDGNNVFLPAILSQRIANKMARRRRQEGLPRIAQGDVIFLYEVCISFIFFRNNTGFLGGVSTPVLCFIQQDSHNQLLTF
jgi:hypothetical protein